jgi:hypothetical protein
MKFDEQLRLNKPAETVLKMYSDRAYFERKYARLDGVKDFEVLECEKKGDSFRIKHRSLQRSDIAVPDFAKKFLGEYSTVTQTDTWNLKTGTGRLDIELKGVPLKISADMKVSGTPNATNQFVWQISCAIPLLGGKLEKLIADDVRAKVAADETLSNLLLADY